MFPTALMTLYIAFLLPLAYPFPFIASLQLLRRGGSRSPTPWTWCSVDTSTASVVPFAHDPGWHASMGECMQNLAFSADSWNGTECVPKTSNGTQLGPTFGFWKDPLRKDIPNLYGGMYPEYCYMVCAPCLQKGIDKLLAVTTRCTYRSWPYGSDTAYGCDFGFDYGQ